EIVDRRVGRDLPSEDSHALAAEANEKVALPGSAFELRATVEHRGALVVRSSEGPLSAEVGNTDPADRKEGPLGVALETFENHVVVAEALVDTEEARRSADLVNRYTEESGRVLDASEVNARRRTEGRLAANLILSRDAGDHVPRLVPIKERFGPAWGGFVERPGGRGVAR